MARPPLFDVIRASALLEKLCAQFIANQRVEVQLEWLKLGEENSHGFDLHWRMRNVVSGRYVDARVSCMSRAGLAWLGSVGSRGQARATWNGEFDKEARSLMNVIMLGLTLPDCEWSKPRPRRERQ